MEKNNQMRRKYVISKTCLKVASLKAFSWSIECYFWVHFHIFATYL